YYLLLLGNDDLGAAQDEFGLLAGPAALALLGDQERAEALDAGAADALVDGRVVGRADDGVVGQDAVPGQRRLDLARLHLDGLDPAGHGVAILGRRPGADNAVEVHAQLQQFVEQRQADPLLAVDLGPQLLVGALGVSGEAVEAPLEVVA